MHDRYLYKSKVQKSKEGKLEMRNILVTGGAGFIGSYLCKALVDKDLDVFCIDNLQRGNLENIKPLVDKDNFTFINEDVCNQTKLEDIIKNNHIDYVFHLAANTDLWESMKNPDIEHEYTFMTTKSLMNAMRNQGVHDMFFASTSAIYGEQTGDGFREEDKLFPISYYGAAKMASEAYIYAFAYMNNINVLIYRFSNIIGGSMTHGVIRDFILRLQKTSDHLDVKGNGYQTKPYLHVTELIDAILMFPGTTKGIEIYNVGATTCSNVRFIANAVVNEMGLTGIPINYEERENGWKGDVAHYEYNIDRIKAKGWNWKQNSDEAVLRTVHELVEELRDSNKERQLNSQL